MQSIQSIRSILSPYTTSHPQPTTHTSCRAHSNLLVVSLLLALAITSTKLVVPPELQKSNSNVSSHHTSQCNEAKLATDDAARLSSKVRSELPGKEKEAKTQLKLSGEQAGKSIDSAVCIHSRRGTSILTTTSSNKPKTQPLAQTTPFNPTPPRQKRNSEK